MFVCNCLITPTPIPPIIRQNKKLYHWVESFVLLSLYLTIFHLYIRTNGKTAMESPISVFTVYLFTAYIFHCPSRCFFFFQFSGYLLVHVLNSSFFSWNCILRKENIFAYLLPGTFVGWQLQNKLFNKPGLLTGSSGQKIFQIKLIYCSSAFFHLSASWTLFWSWMPDKLCHEKIYVSYDILVSPPTPTPFCKDPAWDLHIYRLEILSVLSGTSFDQVARVYRLFRGSDSCTYSVYRFFTTMHMVLIIWNRYFAGMRAAGMRVAGMRAAGMRATGCQQ